MSDLDRTFEWEALPGRSVRRIKWDNLFNPLVGQFHFGPATEAQEECTSERLTALKASAEDALNAARPEFAGECERLRRERHVVLGVAQTASILLIIFGCLYTSSGSELIKAFLTAGGSGGLMTWGLAYAFARADHETRLRLFTVLFAAEFALCTNCVTFERAIERFARAADALRGMK